MKKICKSNENIEFCKNELIKRYSYIYENALFVLSSFMYMRSNKMKKTFKELLKDKKSSKYLNEERNSIFLEDMNTEFLQMLEDLSLSNLPMEKTKGYLFFESLKNNKEYLDKAKVGLFLLNQNNELNSSLFNIELNEWKIFSQLYEYIDGQIIDFQNKKRKLEVIDEYFRISRYSNDGKVWTSGYYLNMTDLINNNFESFTLPRKIKAILRNEDDFGIKVNSFINGVANISKGKNNAIHLTEEEKQAIYLKYHDEIPYGLSVICKKDTSFIHPDNTNYCLGNVPIKEKEIFTFENNFYQLCPTCGYIVNIPNELLSKLVQEKIIARCNNDSYLFRKMYLYSELQALDNLSVSGQKRFLKK